MSRESHSKILLGIIGTGRIAGRFVSTAQNFEKISVVCVYNPNRKSAELFAEEHNITNATDCWEEFLNRIEAAYIASPHETHALYAQMLLEVKRHVLCEKPMSLHREAAENLYRLAKLKGCILKEAVKTAYCPGFMAMMDIAKSGKIGQIQDVEACFTKLTPTDLREMTDVKYGGSVTELASYVLLPIWKLYGTNYEALSYQSLYGENGVDVYTKLFFTFKDGLAEAKIGLGVKSEGQLVISGTKGYILCESPWWLTKKFEVRYENPNKRELYEYPFDGSGLQYELEVFLREICGERGGSCVGITPEEGIANADVMEYYLSQQKQRREISNQFEK